MRKEGLLAEYESLRNEIIHSDHVCTTIIGILITFSCTIAGFVIKDKKDIQFLALLPPIWLIGWLYISEKRFVIIRIAHYLSHKIESYALGLGWQGWLAYTHDKPDKNYPKFDPYLLESLVTFIVTFGITFILFYHVDKDLRWDVECFGVWTSYAVNILFAPLLIRNHILYHKHFNSRDMDINKYAQILIALVCTAWIFFVIGRLVKFSITDSAVFFPPPILGIMDYFYSASIYSIITIKTAYPDLYMVILWGVMESVVFFCILLIAISLILLSWECLRKHYVGHIAFRIIELSALFGIFICTSAFIHITHIFIEALAADNRFMQKICVSIQVADSLRLLTAVVIILLVTAIMLIVVHRRTKRIPIKSIVVFIAVGLPFTVSLIASTDLARVMSKALAVLPRLMSAPMLTVLLTVIMSTFVLQLIFIRVLSLWLIPKCLKSACSQRQYPVKRSI